LQDFSSVDDDPAITGHAVISIEAQDAAMCPKPVVQLRREIGYWAALLKIVSTCCSQVGLRRIDIYSFHLINVAKSPNARSVFARLVRRERRC